MKKIELENMNDAQRECAELVFKAIGGKYRFNGNFYECGLSSLKITDRYMELSTFDSNTLTKLVFLAHDMCIKLNISSARNPGVTIFLHKRKGRDGTIHNRHPSLMEAYSNHVASSGLQTGN